jgi:tetratricopeptide (TPR) repeat protein
MNVTIKTGKLVLLLVLAAGMLAVGCDSKPPRIRQGLRHGLKVIDTLAVSSGDAAEVAAVTAAEVARVQYRYRLTVLRGYCNSIGDADRYKWSGQEIENLDDAQWFTWTGIPEVLSPAGESLTNADPRLLVEFVLSARAAYKQAMRDLEKFYRDRLSLEKVKFVSLVRARFDPVRTYVYFFSAEAPPENMKPVNVIPAAEELYSKALSIYQRGSLVPLVPNYSKQRQALRLFLTITEEHPTSTRSPLAAFYIGHIYREYFNENVRAVMWYQRAWKWDPRIQIGARFQAAVVWDYRLQNREKALELYQAVLEHEFDDLTNRTFARRRISELTEGGQKD